MCQGFGLASRSDTEPWESPNTASPKSLWLMLYWLSSSFVFLVRSSVLRWAY